MPAVEHACSGENGNRGNSRSYHVSCRSKQPACQEQGKQRAEASRGFSSHRGWAVMVFLEEKVRDAGCGKQTFCLGKEEIWLRMRGAAPLQVASRASFHACPHPFLHLTSMFATLPLPILSFRPCNLMGQLLPNMHVAAQTATHTTQTDQCPAHGQMCKQRESQMAKCHMDTTIHIERDPLQVPDVRVLASGW